MGLPRSAHRRIPPGGQPLGLDLYDLLTSNDMLPLLVEELKWDDRLARQLFQSLCGSTAGGDPKCLRLLGREGTAAEAPGAPGLQFLPHDMVELEADEE